MRKFRNLKDKLVNGKRESQKLDSVEIDRLRADLTENYRGAKHPQTSMLARYQHKMHTITQQNYKIGDIIKKDCMGKGYAYFQQALGDQKSLPAENSEPTIQDISDASSNLSNVDELLFQQGKIIGQISTLDDRQATQKIVSKSSNSWSFYTKTSNNQSGLAQKQLSQRQGSSNLGSKSRFDQLQTIKKAQIGEQNTESVDNLIERLNKLEQKKNSFQGQHSQHQKIKSQIQKTMASIKVRILDIELAKSSQKDEQQLSKMDSAPIDYDSIDSEGLSQSDHCSLVCETNRDWDEDRNKEAEPFQIKFRRINIQEWAQGNAVTAAENKPTNQFLTAQDDEVEHYINQTFNSQDLSDYESPASPSSLLAGIQYQCTQYEPEIVHLFSYEKQKFQQSPLSKITQRSSQYLSPDSYKHNMSKSGLAEQSLEYKKILFMLETTDRRTKHEKSNTKNQYVCKISDLSEIQAYDSNRFDYSGRLFKEQKSKNVENSHLSLSFKNGVLGSSQRHVKNEALKDIVNMLQTKYNRTLDLNKKNQAKRHVRAGSEINATKLRARV